MIIVVDEMWHYLGRKANKLWIWTAIDRETGRLVDWECGGRDQTTLVHLFQRLTTSSAGAQGQRSKTLGRLPLLYRPLRRL